MRGHEVRAVIRGDLAVTDVTQTFFNARSEELEAEYVVRLPETAIVKSFAVDTGNGWVTATVGTLQTSSGYDARACGGPTRWRRPSTQSTCC